MAKPVKEVKSCMRPSRSGTYDKNELREWLDKVPDDAMLEIKKPSYGDDQICATWREEL